MIVLFREPYKLPTNRTFSASECSETELPFTQRGTGCDSRGNCEAFGHRRLSSQRTAGSPEIGRSSGRSTVQLRIDPIPDIRMFSYAEIGSSSDERTQSPGAIRMMKRLGSAVQISTPAGDETGTQNGTERVSLEPLNSNRRVLRNSEELVRSAVEERIGYSVLTGVIPPTIVFRRTSLSPGSSARGSGHGVDDG
ncbi:hypothetical protein C481_00305 [Natrialba asiatica DSM 12278]|uniref:Uncharacterized protein n=1 Tax=Natrialba asiatica (strain ATCC 700177 / DSM 12278 / JCM 9576 / FERM P-10747 / NBRC 102637 / 172P1) TaxID=29540 RepID=M0B8F5_NATA1|nr:hypothetical protein C481_00305 [Natrialba asiatica DSM 12278]